MSNQSKTNRKRHAYLWVPFNGPSVRSLRSALRRAPTLAGSNVTTFCDGETALFSLAFSASDDVAEALRSWASGEGLALTDTSQWPQARRQQFAIETQRFECRGGHGVLDGAMQDLATRIERATGSSPAAGIARTKTFFGTSVPSVPARNASLRATIDSHVRESGSASQQANSPQPPMPPRRTRTWVGQQSPFAAGF